MREPRKRWSVIRSKLVRASGNRIMEALAEVHHRLQTEADGAGLVVLPVPLAEHRPRDVEVGPRHAGRNELAQEEAGRDRSGQAALRDVVDVGEGRAQRLAVLLHERQLPERLAVVLAG